MEACEFCKKVWDDSDPHVLAEHRRFCLGAALAVTVGGADPHPPGTIVQPYKTYRPKRRKKSSFKS